MDKVKGVIKLDVPKWQIGEPVTVYFKDTMMQHGVCEAEEIYDNEKIIEAWERCKKCDMSMLASEDGKRAYLDCEYTTGLYCRKDVLINDTIKLLKSKSQIVRCKDCKHYDPDKYDHGKGDCLGPCDNLVKVSDNWFCAEGEKKDDT